MKFQRTGVRIIALGTLISALFSNVQLKAELGEVLAATGVAAIGTGAAYFYNKYIYNQAKQQNELLKTFKHDKNYKNLDIKSRNIYFGKWFPSRLQKEYPVPALERDATSNSWKLWFFSFNPFSTKSGKMSEKLKKNLPHLRNNPAFIKESREYYKQFETQSYRDQELNLKKRKLTIEEQRNQREADEFRRQQEDRNRGIRPPRI